MAEENKDLKTEDATPKRVRDTEEKGQFANSRELTSTFVLFMALLSFLMLGQKTVFQIMETWHWIFSQAESIQMTVDELYVFFKWVLNKMFLILSPILLMIMLGGIAANLLQTKGLKFSSTPLVPKFNKLNPLKGVGRLFSKNSLSELTKSLLKVFVLGSISYLIIKSHMDHIPTMMDLSIGQILVVLGEVSMEIILKALFFMIVLAAADYSFQLFQHSEGIRMTKQEVKDEWKETEGDPMIKQRIRSVQLQMARNRMMAAVPEADVIVTNPTHISIALKYDNTKNEAPIVIAKGADNLAKKIRELAEENDIPMVEDKPLAQTLYKTVDVGQIIPSSLFKAIAEILAHVYQLKSRRLV